MRTVDKRTANDMLRHIGEVAAAIQPSGNHQGTRFQDRTNGDPQNKS